MYMQIMAGRYAEDFGKNIVCRFLNSVKTNRGKLACTQSTCIINESVRRLTGENQQDIFVIDMALISYSSRHMLRLNFEKDLLMSASFHPYDIQSIEIFINRLFLLPFACFLFPFACFCAMKAE